MIVKGVIYTDLGEAGGFVQIDWVKRQFQEKLAIDPFPGTLNLRADDDESLAHLRSLREMAGIEITPQEKDFCTAKCFRVLVEGKIPGALILPHVADYPMEKMEIVAPLSIKQTLGVKDGDLLSIEILP